MSYVLKKESKLKKSITLFLSRIIKPVDLSSKFLNLCYEKNCYPGVYIDF